MEKLRIRLVNKIDRSGLVLLGDRYQVSADEKDPQGIIVRSSRIETDRFPSLLAVARAGAGVNNITVERATQSGICVFNTPGANANAVAELVFVMAGIGARNIHLGIEFCRGLASLTDEELGKEVEAGKSAFRGFELAGKTLGVLGLGQIGVRVANGGARREMRTLGFDPNPSGVVHDADVLVALESGKLGCYITDFPSSALIGHPLVITTPHLGASTEESEEHCATMAVRELTDYLEHGSVSHSVNFPNVESIPGDTVHTRLIMINRDKPGMIGFASQTIGSHGINIASYLNESNGTIGYNIIDLEDCISDEVLGIIAAHPDVIRTRRICYR
ncbi:MAG: 3-phosphoglycerate dehydrogenase [Deltaproteobacteria bacterium]|nr:3-phosphoglycerate dehydrogenase [Deltaproteobacteria bacterium]